MLKTYFRTESKFDHVCPFEEPVKYQSKTFYQFQYLAKHWQRKRKQTNFCKNEKTQLDFWIVNSEKTCGTLVWSDTRKGNKMTRMKPLEVSDQQSDLFWDSENQTIRHKIETKLTFLKISYLKLHLATRLKIQNSESRKNQITATFQENSPTKG